MTRLWKDIPADERIDEAFLRLCVGADDEGWVQSHLERLAGPGCPVAVRWFDDERYAPCSARVREGQTACWHHGGTVGKKKLTADQLAAIRYQRELKRLCREKKALEYRIVRLEAELSVVVHLIERLEERGVTAEEVSQ